MRLSPMVECTDVAEAVRLMRAATQTAATDPTTGAIDMDMITTGRSAADRNLLQHLIESLKHKFSSMVSNQTLEVKEVQRLVQARVAMGGQSRFATVYEVQRLDGACYAT